MTFARASMEAQSGDGLGKTTQPADGPACNTNYVAPSGEPCIPNAPDLACRDLAPWGISQAKVVGIDVYEFDRDGDGVGCESQLPGQATAFGDAVDAVAPGASVVAVLVVAVLCVWPVRWAHRLYRDEFSEGQRRQMKFTAAMTLISAFTLLLLGGFLFTAAGIRS